MSRVTGIRNMTRHWVNANVNGKKDDSMFWPFHLLMPVPTYKESQKLIMYRWLVMAVLITWRQFASSNHSWLSVSWRRRPGQKNSEQILHQLHAEKVDQSYYVLSNKQQPQESCMWAASEVSARRKGQRQKVKFGTNLKSKSSLLRSIQLRAECDT